ncbi:MAG: guanylate kinase [Limisphaerales bacterium]
MKTLQTPQPGMRSAAETNLPAASPLLVVISAPSGGGKTTLCQQLLAARPEMERAITCTTRPARPGERDGVDYYFLGAPAFLRRARADQFLEHATVYGNSYGTLKSEVLGRLRQGKSVLLNVDVQGAATLVERARENPELGRALVSVFLTPPSVAVLQERLRKRGTDAPAVIEKRLGLARQEIAQWKHFDYLILSSSISEDLRRMLAIVEAERLRCARMSPSELG